MASAWLFMAVIHLSMYRGGKLTLQNKKNLYPVFGLTLYSFLSFIWHPDITVWGRYQFYLLCGLTVIMAVYQSIGNRSHLNSVFKTISILVGLNLVIGLLESLEILRLPMSPYSQIGRAHV